MSILQRLFIRLARRDDTLFPSPASLEQIRAFEAKNRITLPEYFREWLTLTDGGLIFLPAGVQLYGVAHEPLIDPLDNDRPDSSYIVIGALSDGDPIIFCAGAGSERISIYNHEAGKIEPDESFRDFCEFIRLLPETLGESLEE